MIDFDPTTQPMPMSWDAFQARARAEGIWRDVLEAGVIAGMAGANEALAHVTLPPWAQDMVRNQFPAVPPTA